MSRTLVGEESDVIMPRLIGILVGLIVFMVLIYMIYLLSQLA